MRTLPPNNSASPATNRRRPPMLYAVVALVVAVHLAAAAALAPWDPGNPNRWPSPEPWQLAVQALFVGLVFSQACLVGVFVALAPGTWKLRLMPVMLWFAYLSVLSAVGSVELVRPAFPALSMALVVVALGPFRRRGFRLTASGAAVSGSSARVLSQTSLRDAVLLVTAISVLAAVARLEFLGSLLAVAGMLLVAALASVWAALGSSRGVACSAALLLLAAVAGAAGYAATAGGLPWRLLISGSTFTLLLTSLLMLRCSGVRLAAVTG